MPKILVLSHVALLACLSLLLFPTLATILDDHTRPVPTAPTLHHVALTALVLAVVMFATEVFSGLRIPAVLAAVGTAVGFAGSWGTSEVTTISTWGWAVGWVAVVTWFAFLTALQRRNR